MDANHIFCLALERRRRPTRNSLAAVKPTITEDPRVDLEKARTTNCAKRLKIFEASQEFKKKNAGLIIDTYLSVIPNEVDNED